MKDLVIALIAYLKTKDALAAFLNKLDNAILALAVSDLSHLDTFFTEKEVAMILSVVKNVTELRDLREQLTRTEVITVKLSFKPAALFEKNITDYISKSIKEPCVTQIVYDRSLIAGATVDYKGKYRDYSLKSKLEDWHRRKDLA